MFPDEILNTMLFTNAHYNTINEQKEKVVVLPLGAIEQHGPHLSVSTDTDIVTTVALLAEKRLKDDILLCPTLPFGSSHHHLAFGGTMSVSVETYIRFVTELVESLIQNGFRRIVLLNGHGGNITPVKQVLSMLSNQYDVTHQPNIAL
ncbi:MAG: creatininase family protein, partial [Cyclobacteriaceae bacterium]|nr:creatininase family protein [Cyclobacteriaceae bacterium]